MMIDGGEIRAEIHLIYIPTFRRLLRKMVEKAKYEYFARYSSTIPYHLNSCFTLIDAELFSYS